MSYGSFRPYPFRYSLRQPQSEAATLSLLVTAGTITGTLSATLDAATLSSTATLRITGTETTTLDAATLSSTGTVRITGTLSATLDTVALSATGTVKITGTLSQTLSTVTLSAASTLLIKGTESGTLDSIALSAAGTLKIQGALSQTLADASISSAATLRITGTLANTLDDVSLFVETHSFPDGGKARGKRSRRPSREEELVADIIRLKLRRRQQEEARQREIDRLAREAELAALEPIELPEIATDIVAPVQPNLDELLRAMSFGGMSLDEKVQQELARVMEAKRRDEDDVEAILLLS